MPYTIHVVLGGAPGVGKSTAIAKLKEMRPDIHVNTETLPVLVRKCLARLYRKEGNPTETALKVQIGLLARTILDSFELAKEPGIHVSERDHEDAEVFISQMKQFGFLDDEARELLCDLISALKRTDPRDDVFRILLCAPTNVILDRIGRRGREGEERIEREYILALRMAHHNRPGGWDSYVDATKPPERVAEDILADISHFMDTYDSHSSSDADSAASFSNESQASFD